MKKNKYISVFPFVIVITALIMVIMNLTDNEEVYRHDIEHINTSSSSKGKVFNLFIYHIDQKFGRYGVTSFYAIFVILFIPFAFNWPLIFSRIFNKKKNE